MTKIKLCGMKRQEDIYKANELSADYIGFIFAPKSKRYVDEKKAFLLKKILKPSIKAVGVFVDEDPDLIIDYVQKGIIDIIQLHGHEDEDYIQKLRGRLDNIIFKAFRIDNKEDVARANSCSASYVLLDSGSGGTGEVFDWSLISGITRDYFLAGGLNTENVARAISLLHPYGVDVSSGIERDGFKDPALMEEFVLEARKVDI